MSKTVLGLDLGSNSVGWALLEENNGMPSKILHLGSRIFVKAVEEKTPTPKNKKRRDARLARRVLQRRTRRKQKMLNYLVSLNLLPKELQNNTQPEKLLNEIGNPYELRAKGLDEQLSPHQLGRVLLHFVARRGFLSTKKQLAGNLVDDPDMMTYLAKIEKEETAELLSKGKKPKADDQRAWAFKVDIAGLYQAIKASTARTLGEYLHHLETGLCKRNRIHDGGHLRTDRAMYQAELNEIWKQQKRYFTDLPDDFMEQDKGVKAIIFYQRPLKLKKDRVGKCSLEPTHLRASIARLKVQRFRYWQDINNLRYGESPGQRQSLNHEQKTTLSNYLERNPSITPAAIKKALELPRSTAINLELKNIKGNTTASKIRKVIGEKWDAMAEDKQQSLFEDLFTIKKKSALKTRLLNHWGFETATVMQLCLLEFELGHSNHSLKAINKLLPYLEKGMIYSDARQAASYNYEATKIKPLATLPPPPKTANPIVNKGLQELKRVVNAIIKEHGKPDAIRIEMARDLEMNTTRYKDHMATQKKNQQANEEAQEKFAEFNAGTSSQYARRNDKIKYRLWKDQNERCAYSNQSLSLTQVFSASTEIDHILPYKKSLDDSYMNKVLCIAAENRKKRDRTPIDAWGGDEGKWHQIIASIKHWHKSLKSKVARFYKTENDLQKHDFIETQLNDTRYMSTVAKDYMHQLGCDISVTKGFVVSEIRHQWGFNTLIGETSIKERTDHRHHAIDAVVIAATSRSLYTKAVKQIERNKLDVPLPYSNIRNELDEKLKHIIVSHAPQRKLAGALHEETGAGYIAQHGGLVYRKFLGPELNLENIVDETVKNIVQTHVANYNSAKEAFAADIVVYHKDGKTPIKRVRVLQSKIATTKNKSAEDILSENKFAVKDKQGKVFRWMSYGNNHHVEIMRHKETEEIKEEFITMMEAHRRAMTGTQSAKNRTVVREDIIKTDHGKDYEFLMALHINDMVSIEKEDGERVFYRVQKLNKMSKKIKLTLHTDAHKATEIPDNNTLLKSAKQLMSDTYKLKNPRINVIGMLCHDKTHH